MPSKIKVDEILADLRKESPDRAYIDVRSELEFERGSIPFFASGPILFQSERHQVGTAYKQKGQEAAIQLGYELVGPFREQRVRAWNQNIQQARTQQGVIMCWRGGMRSQIACEWLTAARAEVMQLEGGYKALRNRLLPVLNQTLPLVVLSGLTGSGKTDLLLEFNGSAVDLEGAAQHRGSVFGFHWDEKSQAQASFENIISLKFHGSARHWLIEDESRMIGSMVIPDGLFRQMKSAPLVILDDDREDRVERIWQQYIVNPLGRGLNLPRLEGHFLKALKALSKALDKRFAGLEMEMRKAFAEGADLISHANWIRDLLEHYYDKRYQHGMNRSVRDILFRGSREQCRDFLAELLL